MWFVYDGGRERMMGVKRDMGDGGGGGGEGRGGRGMTERERESV